MIPNEFESRGYAVLPALLDAGACGALLAALDAAGDVAARSLLELDAVRAAARSLSAHPSLAALLPPDAIAIQCTLFDKSPGHDWGVGPHQDLATPYVGALPPDWSRPTRKDGANFALAPDSVLEQLVAVRVQLDSTPGDAGALEVLPGTHRSGRVEGARLAELAASVPRVACPVPRGGALVLRPLLVHASRRMYGDARRRVLHFLYAPGRCSGRTAA